MVMVMVDDDDNTGGGRSIPPSRMTSGYDVTARSVMKDSKLYRKPVLKQYPLAVLCSVKGGSRVCLVFKACPLYG
jgi:hypothetical protein